MELTDMSDGTIVERTPLEIPEGFGEAQSYLHRVIIEDITYLSDGLKVKGYLIRPLAKNLPGASTKAKTSSPLPCLVYNRGGNREFGALTPERVFTYLAQMASWGYVVAASQYRGNMGGEGQEEFGGRDINDVLNLIPLLEGLSEADSSRIGIVGGSRGGLMTYKALTMSSRFKAAAVRCGVSDLVRMGQERKEMDEVYQDLIPDFDPENRDTLKSRSPIFWAEEMERQVPILIVHGTADWRVNPLASIRMAERLLELQHPFRLVLLEGADHGLSEHREEWYRLLKEWMDRYVRDGEELPNLVPHGD